MTGEAPSATGDINHIALFVPTLSGGGVQRVVLIMAQELTARGYRVDLLVARAEGSFVAALPAGVRLLELGMASHLRARAALLVADPGGIAVLARPLLFALGIGPAIRAVPALARYLRETRPDVLFSAKINANLAALLARRWAGADLPVVVSERVNIADKVATSRRWRWRFIAPAIRRYYAQADAIVAVSGGTAEGFARVTGVPRERVRVIYNPVVGPTLKAQAAEPCDHPWLSENRREPVVLAVGRLETRKGFDVLLEALARVRAQRPVRLILLGEGGDRSRLESRVAALGLTGAVDMPGWWENPFAFMARADLFVLASDYEGLPGVLIQAMACGCPVVSTDCPDGPREILEDGRHGRLVPMRDPAAMAKAMIQVLESPPAAPDQLQARADDFSVQEAITRYERLFRAVAQRHEAAG